MNEATPDTTEEFKEPWIIALLGFMVIGGFLFLNPFIANPSHVIASDYSYFLPKLLDGFYWHKVNGVFSIPWFSPSFCGGMPQFGNPQDMTFSVFQLAVLWMDPLSSVKFGFIVYSILGFWGMYFLLQRVFNVHPALALFGATLFLLNGFHTHRALIGHVLLFPPLMLAPWLAFLILRSAPPKAKLQSSFDIAVGGGVIASIIIGGASVLLIPVLVSIVAIGFIMGIHSPTFSFLRGLGKLIGICILGGGLSSAKLVAVFSFMGNFSRDYYLLPGIENFSDLMSLIFQSLFWRPNDELANAILVNSQWALEEHEFDFGVTVIPLVILILLGCHKVSRFVTSERQSISLRKWLCGGGLLAICLIPIVLNYYSPGWNAFLKQLPVIKSSSALIRWIVIYIPVVILVATLGVNTWMTCQSDNRRNMAQAFSLFGVVLLLVVNYVGNTRLAPVLNYNAQPIIEAYEKSQAPDWSPKIDDIGVYRDNDGKVLTPVFRNDALIHGKSQLYCYEALFGYRLESFPMKTLTPGSIFHEIEGRLNIKNPACYQFPKANQCEPGDHFTIAQKTQATAFSQFQPFEFKMPFRQQFANLFNLLLLFIEIVFVFTYGMLAVTNLWKKKL